MVDQVADGTDEIEVEAVPKKKGMSGKKLVLFVVLPLLLIGGGGAGAYFMGFLDSVLGIEQAEEGEDGEKHADKASGDDHHDEELLDEALPSVFHELPPMLVNLNQIGKRNSYLKISIKLEVGSEEDATKLTDIQPRIIDRFQVYLRELRVEDLEGSAGMQRLREELLNRVNKVAHPVKIRDVLFAELLVQ